MNRKVRAAQVAVGSSIAVVAAEVAAGLATGSVSVLSGAVHSAVDLVAAAIALFSVKVSSQPADAEHRYGHGKIENLSALAEALLLFVAAGWIIFESVHKLVAGEAAPAVGLGLLVMGLSAAVNWVVSAYLYRVAREEDSMALTADAAHLRADVWTSLAVFGGLLLVRVTGLAWLDPVMALIVAAMVLKSGWTLTAQALRPLLDTRLPADEEEQIEGIILRHNEAFVEYHDLRTRRSGAERHVDFHLVVHGQRSLEEVHRLCDKIESAIVDRFPLAHVLIHPEPCEEGCEYCQGLRPRRTLMAALTGKRVRRGATLVRRRRTLPEFAD